MENIDKTLAATTQYGKAILSGPMNQNTIKSPFLANNVLRHHEPVATDTVYVCVDALGTNSVNMAQFFMGRNSMFADIFGIKTKKQFINTLEDIIRKWGAMDLLISSSARVEISSRVQDILRGYAINDWQSEPEYQHQNFAKRGYRDIKTYTILIMNLIGANDNEW